MVGNGELLEIGPCQDVEFIGLQSPQADEHADQVWIRSLGRLTDHLFLAIEPDSGTLPVNVVAMKPRRHTSAATRYSPTCS